MSVALVCRTNFADDYGGDCNYAAVQLTVEGCEELLSWMNKCRLLAGQLTNFFQLALWDPRVASYRRLADEAEQDLDVQECLDRDGTWARVPISCLQQMQPVAIDHATADVAVDTLSWTFFSQSGGRVETPRLSRLTIESICQELLQGHVGHRGSPLRGHQESRTRVVDIREFLGDL